MRPELKVDGVVIATGETIGMGKEQTFGMTFSGPSQKTDAITNTTTSGSFNAIGLDLGIIPYKALLDSKTRLEEVKEKLESGTLTGITKEDLMGEILYLTAINYFVQLDVYNTLNQRSAGVVSIRLPSEGITAFELKVDYVWGLPWSASFGGLSIDVDRSISITTAKDGDQNKSKQFVINSGMLSSAMEHSIMEQLFSTETDPAYGVSAVKIISIANNAGIPIYTVDQDNISQIMPLLQVSQEVKTEIQNAVNAGKVVTIPETSIDYHGWQGTGYIVMDPNTGAAAYMICGGLAGGWVILGLLSALLAKFGIALVLAGFILGAPAWLALLGAILVGLAIGLVLSQVLSDEAKAKISLIYNYILSEGLPYLIVLGFGVVWLIAFIVWMISELLLGSYQYRGHKTYYVKNTTNHVIGA